MASVVQKPPLARSKTLIHREQEVEIYEWNGSLSDGSSVPKPVVKHGKGRNVKVKLCPQPSNDASDPLNWPLWKKDLLFLALCFTAGTVGALKSILFTVSSVIQAEYNVSYSSVAALTGVPLLCAAIAGLLSTGLFRIIGKRPIYLFAVILMFSGAMGNMHIANNYAQFMAVRILQGIGWGAFEPLVLSTMDDIYFVHQKGIRTTIYTCVSLASTWGPPILGGYISQSTGGWRQQFMFLTLFQSVSILFAIFCCPESAFSPSAQTTNTPFEYGQSSTVITAGVSSRNRVLAYFYTLHPMPYRESFTANALLAPLRQILTPTTALLALQTAIPTALAFSTASSLSYLFSPMPTFLLPTHLGYLFIISLFLSITLYSLSTILLPLSTSRMTVSLPRSSRTKSRRNLWHLIPATLLTLLGTLGFGFYLSGQSIPSPTSPERGIFRPAHSSTLSLAVVSLFLALMLGGAVVSDVAIWGYVSGSAAAKRWANGQRGRKAGDDDDVAAWNALAFWKNVVTGIMVTVLPMGIESARGLRMTFVGIGMLEVGLCGIVLSVLFWGVKMVTKGDHAVLGRKQEAGLKRWGSSASFLDV